MKYLIVFSFDALDVAQLFFVFLGLLRSVTSGFSQGIAIFLR